MQELEEDTKELGDNEIAGIDTFWGLDTEVPMRIPISLKAVKAAEGTKQVLNSVSLAFLPYCFVCKEPLIWHISPGEDNVLFHCPSCHREWVKDDDWIAKDKKNE